MEEDKLQKLTNFLNQNWKSFTVKNKKSNTLSKHESIKAMLFSYSKGTLEYPFLYESKTGMRQGRIDYKDNYFTIEIDDAQNINAILKLKQSGRKENLYPVWILHSLGKKSRETAYDSAKKYNLTILELTPNGKVKLTVNP
jgi:hypothetical protein